LELPFSVDLVEDALPIMVDQIIDMVVAVEDILVYFWLAFRKEMH
jgi:hypothetical protein